MIEKLAEEKLDKYLWLLEDNDKEKFIRTRLKKSVVEGIFLLLVILIALYFTSLFTTSNVITALIFIFFIVYLNYKMAYWKLQSLYKRKRDEVYQAFPLWVSTLEILIVTNNIPNTFKKSIATCPTPIKADLETFVGLIQYDPENKEYYKDFLSKYEIEEVNEIIMDMYAFNKLNKTEIIYEFKNLNKRLNEMAARIRKNRQNTDLFFISALNSLPLFTLSVYVLLISLLMNIA